MFLKSLKLTNFLSYGESDEWIDLHPINVIVGRNGVGKSNFLEAIGFIRSTTGLSESNNLLATIGRGGGVQNWIWKGTRKSSQVSLDAIFGEPITESSEISNIRYSISFIDAANWFNIINERIEKCSEDKEFGNFIPYYSIENGHGVLRSGGAIGGTETPMNISQLESILSKRTIPPQHQEVLKLINEISKILIYNNWTFGYNSPPKLFQNANALYHCLDSDSANLALVLNKIRRTPEFNEKFFYYLKKLYDEIVDYDVRVIEGMIQVLIHEKSGIVPATQLSDGTLRYMCLLAVLCDPEPRPLVCIEEPELGLHPDIIPYFADLLNDASERTQLIVTTHSDFLVDALTDQPEAVLVAERDEEGTHLNRLDSHELKRWLEAYRLGDLWISGQIGGKRWR